MSCEMTFWKMAWLIAKGSEDSNTKIGAVLVRDGRVVSVGVNREIAKLPGKRGYLHAEVDCLAGHRGGTLYCTMACCVDCAKLIVASGVKEVVTADYDYKKWEQSIREGRKVLNDNGIWVRVIDPYGPLLIGGRVR